MQTAGKNDSEREQEWQQEGMAAGGNSEWERQQLPVYYSQC